MEQIFPKSPDTQTDEAKKDEALGHYRKQTSIIDQDLHQNGNHSLDELVRLMREEGEAAVYLSGTRLDNDYCFGSNDLATAISVLPQDGEKAAEPGYHPGSTEVYVIFQGSLVMEFLDRGDFRTQNCGQFDVVVLNPGICHRVRQELEREAASFIVKTNPHHKPGVLRCKDCTHFKDPKECPLHVSWQRERQELGKYSS